MVTYGEADMQTVENGFHNNNVSVGSTKPTMTTDNPSCTYNDIVDLRIAVVNDFVLTEGHSTASILLVCDSTTDNLFIETSSPNQRGLQFSSSMSNLDCPEPSLAIIPYFYPDTGCLTLSCFTVQCANSEKSVLSSVFEDADLMCLLRYKLEDYIAALVSPAVLKVEMIDNQCGSESPLVSQSSRSWQLDHHNLCLSCLRQYRTSEDFLDHAASVHCIQVDKKLLKLPATSEMIFAGSLYHLHRLQVNPTSLNSIASMSHSSNKENEEADIDVPSPSEGVLEIDFDPRSVDSLGHPRQTLSASYQSSNSPTVSSVPTETLFAPSRFATSVSESPDPALPITSLPPPFATAAAALLGGGLSSGLPTPPLGLPALNQTQMNFIFSLAAQAHAQSQQQTKVDAVPDVKPSGFDEITHGGVSGSAHQIIPPMTTSVTPGGHCARNSNKTIKCPHCNWHYKYQETLEIHLRDKHPEFGVNGSGPGGNGGLAAGASQCFYCQNKQAHPRLSRGETYSCGYKPYRCEVCNYSTTTKGNLSIHIQSDKHINNMHEHNQNLEMNRITSRSSTVGTALDLSSLPAHHQHPSKQQKPLPPLSSSGTHLAQSSTPSTPSLPTAKDLSDSLDPTKTSATSHHVQDLMMSAFNAALGQRLQLPIPSTNPAAVTVLPSILPPQASQPARSNIEFHNIFFCNICMVYGSNSLDDIQTHATLQRSGRAENNDDTMIYHEGYWHCRLCTYKSNLKANFQLHCKTDKHLQRQQLLSHVREGGVQNELRFPNLSTASSIQIRCNCCNFFSTSIHKLRVHAAQAKHEHCAALLHHLNKLEVGLVNKISANGSLQSHVFECRLCRVSCQSKHELMQHFQTEQHEATYSAVQFQYQSQNRLLEVAEIVSLRLTSSLPDPDMTHLQENQGVPTHKSLHQEEEDDEGDGRSQDPVKQCPLCRKCYVIDDQEMRQHLEQEHKITSECVDKFIEMAVTVENPANSQDEREYSESMETDVRITSDPTDESADALLIPEESTDMEDDQQVLRCHGCTATFTEIEELCQHETEMAHNDLSTSAGFLCYKKGCNQYFQSLDFLKLHYREIHGKPSSTGSISNQDSVAIATNFGYPCHLCHLLAFPTQECLDRHKDQHGHLSSPLQCTFCNQQDGNDGDLELASVEDLRQHLRECHMRPEISDHQTSQPGSNSPHMIGSPYYMNGQRLSSFKDPSMKFKCFSCKLGFEKQIQLAAHTRSHSHKRHTVDSIESSLSSNNNSRYMDTSRKFKCEVCRDAFTSRQMLSNHNNSVQHTVRVRELENTTMTDANKQTGQFRCNVCKVSFQQKHEFEQHCMTGEHLTYLANISRLVQEGKMETDKLLLETPPSPQQNSVNMGDPFDFARSIATSSTTAVSAANQQPFFPMPLMSSSFQMLPPGFPMLPNGANPAMLSQFLPQFLFRLPFAPPTSLPSFSGQQQQQQPTPSNLSTNCPSCGLFIPSPEALAQHPCFLKFNATGGIPLPKTSECSTPTSADNQVPTTVSGNEEERMTSSDAAHKVRRPESFRRLLEKTGLDNVKRFLEASGNEEDLSVNPEVLNATNHEESNVTDDSEADSSHIDIVKYENDPNDYICQKCNRKFNESLLLKLHYEQDHNDILSTAVIQNFGEKLRDYMIEANKSRDADSEESEKVKIKVEENTSLDEDLQQPLVICTETTGSSDSNDLSTFKAGVSFSTTSEDSSHQITKSSPLVIPTPTHARTGMNMLPQRGNFVAGPFGMLPTPLGFPLSLLNQSSTANSTPISISNCQFTTPPPPPPTTQSSVTATMTFPSAGLSDGQKRGRTRINEEQLKVLRSYFDISNSPSDAKIQEMSQMTGLQNRVIKHWFRNTLFKERQRNKNSPYNFSVPPSTSLNLEEYEKTGRVEVKASPEDPKRRTSSDDISEDNLLTEELHSKQIKKEFDVVNNAYGVIYQPLSSIDQNKNIKKEMDTTAENIRTLSETSPEDVDLASGPISPSSSVSLSESGTSEGEVVHRQHPMPNPTISLPPSSASILPLNTTACTIPTNLMLGAATNSYSQWADLIMSGSQPTTANLLAAAAAVASSSSIPSLGLPDHHTTPQSYVPVGNKSTLKRKHREDEEDEVPSGKRIRTTISSDQQEVLLNYYQKDPNPSRKQMDIIANQVVLSKRVVQVWFQNTRSRDRKGLLRSNPVTSVSQSSSYHHSSVIPTSNTALVTINKRCPFCRVLFKIRNALEVHLSQCHSDRCIPGQISVDSLPNEPEMSVESLPQSTPLQESHVPSVGKTYSMDDDTPLDLSRASGGSGRSTLYLEDLDDSQTVYWDDDCQEPGMNGFGGGSGGSAGNKRNRTNINLNQMRLMKSIFHYYKTPSNQECDALGTHIGLTRRVVQVWFQNQRAKEKKQCRESMPAKSTSTGSKGAILTCVLGSDQTVSGCELCGTQFSDSGNFLIQEHLFSADHLDRLLKQISLEERLQDNFCQPLTSATSSPQSGSISLSSQSEILPTSCGATISSNMVASSTLMFPPANYPMPMGMVWPLPQISVNGKHDSK